MIAFLLTLLLATLPHAGHHAHPADTGGGTPMNGTAEPADTGGGTPMH